MEQKQAIADRLKQANNILVTVSNNPSVDQLASCIGLTLALNKMGKHATAVFSGNVPSTLEFLQPEKTLEKNTDSLRDFIIALDKAKADKLRYKVEDKVVKIFITPYKTSITEKDLEFSQGDFNVDVVIALGVHQQTDLDQAITSHGRILHDAVVATMNTKPAGELGTINWLDTAASSLSQLVAQLLDVLDNKLLDGQMATALLTGIVAETNRFSNEKTTPVTMSIAAELMGAGANQQLVATKLQEPAAPPPPPVQQDQGAKLQERQHSENHAAEDGTLEIAHAAPEDTTPPPPQAPEHEAEKSEPETQQIHIDDQGSLRNVEQIDNNPNEPLVGGSTDPTQHMASSHMILQPPAMGGEMSANTAPAGEEAAAGDPLSLPQPDEPGFGSGGDGTFGGPPASANITPPAMPYLPPSMTPGAPLSPVAPPPPPTPAPMPPAPQVVTPLPPLPQPAPMQPAPYVPPAPPPPPPPPAPMPMPAPEPPSETLSQIEADVNSPHLQPDPLSFANVSTPGMPHPQTVAPTIMPPAPEPAAAPLPPPTAPPAPIANPDLASARDAVLQAIAGQSGPAAPEPIQALNAQPLGSPLHEAAPASPAPGVVAPAAPINMDATANPTFTLPDASQPGNGAAPPSVPPPMMPPGSFGQ
jgi:hypothetical protein